MSEGSTHLRDRGWCSNIVLLDAPDADGMMLLYAFLGTQLLRPV